MNNFLLKVFKYKAWIITGFLLLTTFITYNIFNLKVEYQLEKFFPKDTPELDFLFEFEKAIEPDDNYILVAVENDQSIFDSVFLQKCLQFKNQALQIEGIIGSRSLLSLREPVKGPLGFLSFPVLHLNDPERYASDSAKIFEDERWPGSLISSDSRGLAIIFKTEDYLDQKVAEPMVDSLFSLAKSANFASYHLAGRSVTQIQFLQTIQNEVVFYVAFSCLLLFLILFLVYRRFWGVVIPLVSVILGLLLFFGILGLIGIPLNLMSTLFPALMLIIGMSDVVHIMGKYIDEQIAGYSREQSMILTIREIGFATLLTSVTTAIGFLALLSSKIGPIRGFGVQAAGGVFLAYITVMVFTCMWLLYFKAEKLSSSKWQLNRWNYLINKIYLFVSRKPLTVMIGVVLVLIISFIGISKVSTNMQMLSDVPRDDKLRQDFVYFEEQFSGVRPLEIAIMPADTYSVFKPDVMKEIKAYHDHLEESEVVQWSSSPLDALKSINKSLKGGKQEAYSLPNDSLSYEKALSYYQKFAKRSSFKLTDSSDKVGRITGRVKDIGSDSILAFYDRLTKWESENIDSSLVDFVVTGKLYLVDLNNRYLTGGLFSGLLFAFGVVAILMGLLFKSWKMMLISLVPNMVPLIVAGGIMGFTGIELKSSTSIIFTIAFGVAVDDTIHFLSRFRIERYRGIAIVRAVQRTFLESGKAILLTTIILLAGFLSLAFSNFTATYYIGLLISVTLFTALLADLLILPLLIYWFYNK